MRILLRGFRHRIHCNDNIQIQAHHRLHISIDGHVVNDAILRLQTLQQVKQLLNNVAIALGEAVEEKLWSHGEKGGRYCREREESPRFLSCALS